MNTGVAALPLLQSGGVLGHVDAGVYKLATVGNYIWKDLNGNGVQDDGVPVSGGAQTQPAKGA